MRPSETHCKIQDTIERLDEDTSISVLRVSVTPVGQAPLVRFFSMELDLEFGLNRMFQAVIISASKLELCLPGVTLEVLGSE